MTKDSPAAKFVLKAWVQAGFAGLLVLVMGAVIYWQAYAGTCKEKSFQTERAFFVDLQLKQYDQLRERNDQLMKLLQENQSSLNGNTLAINGIASAVTSLDRSINELRNTIKTEAKQ